MHTKKQMPFIKIISVMTALIMILTAVPLPVSAAVDSGSLAVESAQVSPALSEATYNQQLIYTVVTGTAATKVKIAYPNGELYYFADISAGFNNYSDSGSKRTWTITRRNQWIGDRIYYVYAGDGSMYGAEGVTVGKDQPVVINPSVTLDKVTVSLKTGETSALRATVKPDSLADKAVSWGSSNTAVATVSNGTVTAVAAGSAIITASLVSDSSVLATCKVTVTEQGGTDKTEPPYPFWKDYQNYSTAGTKVYYYGNIYQNQWYANAGALPTDGGVWALVGPAEWTVEEDPSNYTKSEQGPEVDIDKILTDSEITELWGGINEEYSTESALGRLEELMPESYYEELFPYRFGSANWKALDAAKAHYPDPSALPDYYSYDNLKAAITELSDIIIKVEWYEGAAWCYRLTRLNKSTKEQKLIYSDPSFEEDWLVGTKEKVTVICDYGSFLAVGDIDTRKKELAGFLANISHETGGGSADGVVDELYTGLFFNEEVGLINSTAENYVQSTGTAYLPVAGKSYHGRGPIQLSYNYNYGLCSDVLYGDSSVLLEDPDIVDRDGVVGFMTGIWFWMTPQPPKPSCHQVITGTWNPAPGATNSAYNGQFGLTIVIINNESGQSENGSGAVARRCRYFRAFCTKMGVNLGGEQVDTMGMTSFTQT